MLPVIAIVGRPNVGKSTLFNRLTGTRDALVADYPGLTRDRKYGDVSAAGRSCIVVDTGGLSGDGGQLGDMMAEQVWQAVDEADLVLFMVDARSGPVPADAVIAGSLRRTGKQQILVVNKTDGIDVDAALAEFHELGLGEPQPVSAAHGRGIRLLLERVMAGLPAREESAAVPAVAAGIRVAVAGRPNVGKSTLINRLLGAQRVLASDLPGTTRDSICIPFSHGGTDFTLIDTAGVRRRARVHEAVEKFSVIKTLQAIDEANVVVLVLDARQEISEQDASLAGYILDKGRALVIAVNKWDGLDEHDRQQISAQLERRLPFTGFARRRFISAREGTGTGVLFADIRQAYAAAMRDLPTPQLCDILAGAVREHQPPMVHGRRIRLRYAHQGGRNPPLIVIHGNQTERVPDVYRRYLMNTFRDTLHLEGTPLRIEFRTGDNPYRDRRNRLSPRQLRHKDRLMRHVKRKKH